MQAAELVQEAKGGTAESEDGDDWEAAAESWEDMDAVPAIGPAATEAKRKVCFNSRLDLSVSGSICSCMAQYMTLAAV